MKAKPRLIMKKQSFFDKLKDDKIKLRNFTEQLKKEMRSYKEKEKLVADIINLEKKINGKNEVSTLSKKHRKHAKSLKIKKLIYNAREYLGLSYDKDLNVDTLFNLLEEGKITGNKFEMDEEKLEMLKKKEKDSKMVLNSGHAGSMFYQNVNNEFKPSTPMPSIRLQDYYFSSYFSGAIKAALAKETTSKISKIKEENDQITKTIHNYVEISDRNRIEKKNEESHRDNQQNQQINIKSEQFISRKRGKEDKSKGTSDPMDIYSVYNNKKFENHDPRVLQENYIKHMKEQQEIANKAKEDFERSQQLRKQEEEMEKGFINSDSGNEVIQKSAKLYGQVDVRKNEEFIPASVKKMNALSNPVSNLFKKGQSEKQAIVNSNTFDPSMYSQINQVNQKNKNLPNPNSNPPRKIPAGDKTKEEKLQEDYQRLMQEIKKK